MNSLAIKRKHGECTYIKIIGDYCSALQCVCFPISSLSVRTRCVASPKTIYSPSELMVGRQSFRGLFWLANAAPSSDLFTSTTVKATEDGQRSIPFPKDWDHNLQFFAGTMAGYAPMFLPNL